MGKTLRNKDFASRLSVMLNVDMRRMFTQSLFYIMLGICFIIPVIMPVMTQMNMDADTSAMFTNVWQLIGSSGSGAMGMDLTSMCNMNMVYFLAAVLICVFMAADFKSGFCKNIFSVRARRGDYVASKIITGFICGCLMHLVYFTGAMFGGKIAGLSFAMEGFGIFNIVMSIIAKLFLMAVFAAIYVVMGTIAKQRTWLSILLSLFVGMFMFMVIPMMTPLTSGFMNAAMCLAGGVIFSTVFGRAGEIVLRKGSILS